MTKKFQLMLLLFVIFTVSNAQEDNAGELGFINEEQRYQVSLYKLVSQPDLFDEKPVYITGYVKFEYSFRVYPDKSSCEDSFLINSVVVSVDNAKYKEYAEKHENCSTISVYGKYHDTSAYGKKWPWNLSMGSIVGPIKVFEY